MMKLFFLLVLIAPFFSSGQPKTDLDFLIQKIKVDYPGYEEKIKGINFDEFVEQTISENNNDTFKIMSKIVNFFNDRHLDLFRSKQPIDTNVCNKNLAEVLHYFRSNKRLKTYEGFWVSEFAHCIIAIKQTSQKPLSYKGYVVESRDSNKIRPGFAYYDFEEINKNLFFTRATSSGSGMTFYVKSNFRNDSLMTAGPYNKWKRINHLHSSLKYFQEKSDVATGKWLDSNNYVISIPSSTVANGIIVDSLIKSNPAITSKLKNLIVDIRGNTGGRVQAYASLIPLLYTNPIVRVNGSIYCSQDYIDKNQKEIDEYVSKGNVDSLYLNQWKDWVSFMASNIGKFIETPQDTIKLDNVSTYPKRVSLLIDYACQSAAEIFLLEALQSKKAILFGEHTMGAIDYLNFYPQVTPSGKYTLYVATTQRTIPKGGKKLDGIGIHPSVQISDKEKDWIEYIKRYYEKN